MKLFLSDRIKLGPVIILSAVIFAVSTQAGKITQIKQSSRLYTPGDPSARGGIHGRIKGSRQLLHDVFAVPSDNLKFVYRGTVSADGSEFSFKGLPVAKYDLMLVGPARFYEGFELTQETDSLTAADRKMIEAIIMKSVPFFNVKKIHRCQGITGRTGTAKCVLQEVRNLPITLQDASVRTDFQLRSIKLACLEDVGPAGWQLVNTREIIRMEVGRDEVQNVLPHACLPALGQIRVVDEVKELGDIELPTHESVKP